MLSLAASSTYGSSGVTQVTVNWGDTVNGNPDVVPYGGNPTSETHNYGLEAAAPSRRPPPTPTELPPPRRRV